MLIKLYGTIYLIYKISNLQLASLIILYNFAIQLFL
jgi:hypothetical protein